MLTQLSFSRPCLALRRYLSWTSCSRAADYRTPEEELDKVEYFRKRKTEWKRLQKGGSFLDHRIVTIRGGRGGNGCAAFHREKYIPFGPPSGGNGGRGGDVYLIPSPEVTTLTWVPSRIVGNAGGNGLGSWRNGKNGEPTIVKVPIGTVVEELPRGDLRRSPDEWEAEEVSVKNLSLADRIEKMRDNRWIHYPRHAVDNVQRESFRDAEKHYYALERERKLARRKREIMNPISLDLDEELLPQDNTDSPLGRGRDDFKGYLVASGGLGGLGNPHFLTDDNRSPKYASAGQEGEWLTLSLELKLVADIGLVGMPNAGKSTLLRAVTGGRVKTEVAGYAFTTLNPVVGVVRVSTDGIFEGSLVEGNVYDETRIEEEDFRTKMEQGYFAESPTRNQSTESNNTFDEVTEDVNHIGHRFDLIETARFTIADNPGLIEGSSENIGLGHSFLRSMERSLALVYVVDMAGPEPWNELVALRNELEEYLPGLSSRARMVIANKADLMAEGGDPEAVAVAQEKLRHLQQFVRTEMALVDRFDTSRVLDVVPVSAKFGQNLSKVVKLMQTYVEEAKMKEPQ